MAEQYNRSLNGNTRLQSGLGRVQEFQPAQADTLIMAQVLKVNFIYNTVDLITTKAKERLVKGQQGNGKFSAKLPVSFGGSFQTGMSYGNRYPIAKGDTVLVGFLDKNKNTPIVLGIYETQDIASELAPTDAISGDPESPDILPEAMSHFTLFPSQTYREVNGEGYIESTFPGKSFFKLVSGQTGRFRLNDSTYSYSNLSRYKLRGRDITPTATDAPQILFQHVGAGSRYVNNVFFDTDGTFRISKVTTFDDERIDVQSGSNKDFFFRYQDDKKQANDDTATVISEVGIKDGVPILRLNDHILTFDKYKGVMVDGVDLRDYVSGTGSDLQKIVDQLVIDMKNTKKNLSQFEIDIRKELADKALEIYAYVNSKLQDQNGDLTALQKKITELEANLRVVKSTADDIAKIVSDASGKDASLLARLNRIDNSIVAIDPYLQEIKDARTDNIIASTSDTLGKRLDAMSKYMRDLNPRILDNASAINALDSRLTSLKTYAEALKLKVDANPASITEINNKIINDLVHRTGNESIAGTKTFINPPFVPAIEVGRDSDGFIDFHTSVNPTTDYEFRIMGADTKGLYTHVQSSGVESSLVVARATDTYPLNIDTMVGGLPNPGGLNLTITATVQGGTKPFTGTLPSGVSMWSVLEHFAVSTNNATQRMTDTSTGKMYTRSMNSAKWTAWTEIGANGSNLVHLTGDERIEGAKTFDPSGIRIDTPPLDSISFPLQTYGGANNTMHAPLRTYKKLVTDDAMYGWGIGGLNIYGAGESAGGYTDAVAKGTVPSGLPQSGGIEALILSADQNVWIMPNMQDPAQAIGSDSNYYFNTQGYMGKRINNANTMLVNPTGTWIGPATQIPANANINNYNIPGDYSVNLDATAKTLSNTPTNPSTQTGKAFNMTVTVSNPVGMVYQTLRTYQGWVFERVYYNGAWTQWAATAGIMHTTVKGPFDSTIRLSRSANVVYAELVGMSGGGVAGGATTVEAIPADYRPVSFTAGVASRGVIQGYWQAQVLRMLPDGSLKNYGSGSYSGDGSGSWLVYNQ